MNVYSVTLHFTDFEAFSWFARCAQTSATTKERLPVLQAGIMQDSIKKAFDVSVDTRVVGEPQPETPIEYAAWETDGGTTAEQNDARFGPDLPVGPTGESLVCESCGSTKSDVVETTCPYSADVHNDPNVPAVLCKACYQDRCDDI